jgi:ribosome-associated protein
MTPDDLVTLVTGQLDADKAEDIQSIDLRGRSSMADHIVIATGTSNRQVAAMAEHLVEKLKANRYRVALEGMPQGDWVLVDAGDIVIHLFRPEVRSYYNLERMWSATESAAAAH